MELRQIEIQGFPGLTGLAAQGDGLPRSLELVLSLAGLILLSPLLAVSAILVRVSSSGPVLFRQERMGRNGKRFVLLKFRTMRVHDGGTQVTAKGDPRVTPVGRLLRKTKLDELPELWNVARGDLSLVGPRPEVPRYVDLQNPCWVNTLRVRPGITDPVTLRLRNEEELLAECSTDPEAFYRHKLQNFKLHGYLQYLSTRTWKTDVEVLLRTLMAVVVPSRTVPPSLQEIEESQFHENVKIQEAYP